MGSGSSSAVKPFKRRFSRSESRNSSRSQFPPDILPNFQQHLIRNKEESHSEIIADANQAQQRKARNVSEIHHPSIRGFSTEDAITSSPFTRMRWRQESERNPFEIMDTSEASDRLPITHSASSATGEKTIRHASPAEVWAAGESFSRQGMAWNQEAVISADVDRLSNRTKRISRSVLSHEDSADEATTGRSDPRLLTSQALSEIDHLLSSHDDEQGNRADAFLLSLDRKRGQSVFDVTDGRHVSLIFLLSIP